MQNKSNVESEEFLLTLLPVETDYLHKASHAIKQQIRLLLYLHQQQLIYP